jgi:hypothetical protein
LNKNTPQQAVAAMAAAYDCGIGGYFCFSQKLFRCRDSGVKSVERCGVFNPARNKRDFYGKRTA